MKHLKNTELLEITIQASLVAGKKIMEIYNTDFEVDYKEDNSPLTLADKGANKIIENKLQETGIPILSEEGKHLPYSERKNWNKLWIVDPLDGTKEFVKRNGEFTVNIALVEKNIPIMGVIFCPTLKILYFADQSVQGAYKAELNDDWETSDQDFDAILKSAVQIPEKSEHEKFMVVASRSHLNDETKNFVDRLKKQVGEVEFLSRGSSLKLCMVAEAKADLYPRFAPTSEWDTAAGQAIVSFSGGKVIDMNTKDIMRYNKENILNPWFLVIGKSSMNKIDI